MNERDEPSGWDLLEYEVEQLREDDRRRLDERAKEGDRIRDEERARLRREEEEQACREAEERQMREWQEQQQREYEQRWFDHRPW